jgi:PhnB protein
LEQHVGPENIATYHTNDEAGAVGTAQDYFPCAQQLLSQTLTDTATMQSVTKVKHIPQGYHSVSPYLVVDGAARLIDFVKQTFNAVENARMNGPEGRISHAEVKIGDSIIMLSDSTPEYKAMPAMLYVYVEDVDAVYKKALQAGATSVSEPKNQFYGDRSAGVKDPLGNQWGIATHVEEVPPEEMQRRMKEQANR